MHLELTAVTQIKQNWLRKYMTADISVCKASAESVLFISTHPKLQSRRLMCWPPFILMLNEMFPTDLPSFTLINQIS